MNWHYESSSSPCSRHSIVTQRLRATACNSALPLLAQPQLGLEASCKQLVAVLVAALELALELVLVLQV